MGHKIEKHTDKKTENKEKMTPVENTPVEPENKEISLAEQLSNSTGLKFVNISGISARRFCMSNGKDVIVNKPIAISVANGIFRVFSAEMKAYVINVNEGWYVESAVTGESINFFEF